MGQKEGAGPGAPKLQNGKRQYLTIRIDKDRVKRYKAAAKRARLTLSEWIRKKLDEAVSLADY
jgi:predicted HicB family RNase H-like nuclease